MKYSLYVVVGRLVGHIANFEGPRERVLTLAKEYIHEGLAHLEAVPDNVSYKLLCLNDGEEIIIQP